MDGEYIASELKLNKQIIIWPAEDLPDHVDLSVTGLWLVEADHVTWILASDWSGGHNTLLWLAEGTHGSLRGQVGQPQHMAELVNKNLTKIQSGST